MDFSGFNSFEDFFKAFGYTDYNEDKNSENYNCNIGYDYNNQGCNDIPNGFQSINPQLFVIIGQILGDIIAGNLPFNVQNVVGNLFQLVGQVILTFNAQQQYFQGGPGRYYNPTNYNVTNPFCKGAQGTEGKSSSGKTVVNENITGTYKNSEDDIMELKIMIRDLICEINDIKARMETINRNN